MDFRTYCAGRKPSISDHGDFVRLVKIEHDMPLSGSMTLMTEYIAARYGTGALWEGAREVWLE